MPVARQLYYAGSVKWLDQPFDGRDLAALQRAAPQVPGFESDDTAMVAVSRAGFADTAASHLALRWQPSDVVSAFT